MNCDHLGQLSLRMGYGGAVLQVQAAATRLWKRIAGEQDDYIANPKVGILVVCGTDACRTVRPS